jgi:DNA-binding GntR family transcriptional regulator
MVVRVVRVPASATTDAYRQLKRLIQTLELPPGAPMSEPMLMELLETGRTPIREALRRLSDDRLVVIFPRRGLVVAQLGIAEVMQLYEARTTLERQNAFLAAERADHHDLRRLNELNDAVILAEQRNVFEEFLDADQMLHQEIAKITRNSFLIEASERLMGLNLWLWYSHMQRYGIQREDFASHHAVLAAIAARDQAAAAAAMEAHIQHSRSILRLAL